MCECACIVVCAYVRAYVLPLYYNVIHSLLITFWLIIRSSCVKPASNSLIVVVYKASNEVEKSLLWSSLRANKSFAFY